LEFEDYYVVEPEFHWWSSQSQIANGGKAVTEGFVYASNTNDKWLTKNEMEELIQD